MKYIGITHCAAYLGDNGIESLSFLGAALLLGFVDLHLDNKYIRNGRSVNVMQGEGER